MWIQANVGARQAPFSQPSAASTVSSACSGFETRSGAANRSSPGSMLPNTIFGPTW